MTGGTMSGGTLCRFTVGRPGTSAAHLRYIAREAALHREAGQGSLLLRLPEFLMGEGAGKQGLREIVRWADLEEREEQGRYRGHGSARAHYQAIAEF